MSNVARLKKDGVLSTSTFDDNTKSSFSVSSDAIAYSNEFKEPQVSVVNTISNSTKTDPLTLTGINPGNLVFYVASCDSAESHNFTLPTGFSEVTIYNSGQGPCHIIATKVSDGTSVTAQNMTFPSGATAQFMFAVSGVEARHSGSEQSSNSSSGMPGGTYTTDESTIGSYLFSFGFLDDDIIASDVRVENDIEIGTGNISNQIFVGAVDAGTSGSGSTLMVAFSNVKNDGSSTKSFNFTGSGDDQNIIRRFHYIGTPLRQNSDGSSEVGTIIDETEVFNSIRPDDLELHYNSELSSYIVGTGGTAAVGQQVFTSNGTFTVPAGVTQVSAVVIGGGGGGGNSSGSFLGQASGAGGGAGGLSYGTFSVTPGETLTVNVGSGGGVGSSGGSSSIVRSSTTLLQGSGGTGGGTNNNNGTGGGSSGTERDGGGDGGAGGDGSGALFANAPDGGGAGGGAGGYSGNGGAGGGDGGSGSGGSGGSGGGGGAGSTNDDGGGGGGGVGLLGEGSNGSAGSSGSPGNGGGAGSGGSNGSNGSSDDAGSGGNYGGGGGGGGGTTGTNGNGAGGGAGAARIIWGAGRSYPSTNTADETPSSGATFYWDDLSGNDRDAKFGSASLKSGQFIDFDGTDDEAVCDGTNTGSSAYTGVTGTTARTVAVTFKTDTTSTTQRLFAYGANATGQRYSIQLTSDNKIRLELGNGYVETSSTVMSDGNWHTVAITSPSSSTNADVKIWIDGEEDTSLTVSNGSNSINTSSSNNITIASQSLVDGSTPSYFNGLIQKVIVFSRELSELEIKHIYQDSYARVYG